MKFYFGENFVIKNHQTSYIAKYCKNNDASI